MNIAVILKSTIYKMKLYKYRLEQNSSFTFILSTSNTPCMHNNVKLKNTRICMESKNSLAMGDCCAYNVNGVM